MSTAAPGDPVTVTIPGAGDWPAVVAEVMPPASGTTVVQSTLFFRTVDDAAAWLRGTLHRLVVAEAKPTR